MPFSSTFRWLSAAVIASTALLLGVNRLFFASPAPPSPASFPHPAPAFAPKAIDATDKIQIAFILDVSGSMEGLIEQAKARLWSILNEASDMERNGRTPEIEVALYSYGDHGMGLRSGYIKRRVAMTHDVDEFSEALFALRTGGSEEYGPLAVQRAATELDWDTAPGTVRLLYIAGNETFQQGPIATLTGFAAAQQRGIVVNTIYCDDPNDAIASGWIQASRICAGDFFSINHNDAVVDVASPFDDRIAAANVLLNQTYVPINRAGLELKEKQLRQDANAASLGAANLCSRAKFKAGKSYKAEAWDLVDAARESLDKVLATKDQLPDSLAVLSDAELKVKIKDLVQCRENLQFELNELAVQRSLFVENVRLEAEADQSNTLGERMKVSLRGQLGKVGYRSPAKK